MCCWTAGRSRPPSASAPAVKWRPATELEKAEAEREVSESQKAFKTLVGLNVLT